MSNDLTQKSPSSLEEMTKDMTWQEVDEVWHKMEDNLPYISALARGPASSMIKELRVISRQKYDKEFMSDR